jgi:phosphoglycerate dehydrogenase-like enzyme
VSDDAQGPVVVLSASPAGRLDADDELAGAGLTALHLETAGSFENFDEMMRQAFGAVLGSERVDRDMLTSCPHLRVIARTGVGTDGIDIDAATQAGVLVTTTPGVNENTVAEHTLALMLAAVRRIPDLDRDVRAGEWVSARAQFGSTVRGATVGIVGLGAIGAAVANLVAGLGASVLACDPVASTLAYPTVDLRTLLRRSDIVSLHVPLTRDTKNLIGRTELQQMRRTALLVNTARGGLIDEDALLAALEAGEIGGAALDVRSLEPPNDERLTSSPLIVSTPHVAAFSPCTIAEMRRRAVRSVIDVFRGRLPSDPVNPSAFNVSVPSSPQPSAANPA